METIIIHICDWNLNDRVITVPKDKAAVILLDTTKLASDRMSTVYSLARDEGTIISDPRVSEMDEADLFLSWPGDAVGFVPDDRWDHEFEEDLDALRPQPSAD